MRKNLIKFIESNIVFILVFLVTANFYCFRKLNLLPQNNEIEIVFLDVGQGDAVLIKTENNKYGLIDTGPNNNIIYVIEDFLPLNFEGFEFILLTHPDLDHIEGAIELIKRFSVKNIYINHPVRESSVLTELSKEIDKKNIKTYGLYSDNDFILDEIYFDILWPSQKLLDSEEPNNNSITFILSYKNFKAYFGGDIDSKTELATIEGLEEDIDLLKVSHHGSKYSTTQEFLDALSPDVAVVSSGVNNLYGHPSIEVIALLDKNNIEYYRTDVLKSVKLKISYLSYSFS